MTEHDLPEMRMPGEPPPPLMRLVDVRGLPPSGMIVEIAASPEECVALAADFAILAVRRLVARYELKPWRRDGVRLRGLVEGEVTQECVVTLDPVEQSVAEAVELDFLPADDLGPPTEEIDIQSDEHDPPEPIFAGHIDLGIVTAEYLALGLDPYPRKDGAVFEEVSLVANEGKGEVSPFAGLAAFKPPD